MVIIYVTLRQQIEISKDVEVHKCTLIPIWGNLVTNLPINTQSTWVCHWLGLRVVYIYMSYIYIYC
jgi:hypothetical protein